MNLHEYLNTLGKVTFKEVLDNNVIYNFDKLTEVQKRKRARIFTTEEIRNVVLNCLKKNLNKCCKCVPDSAYNNYDTVESTIITLSIENDKIVLNYTRDNTQTCGTIADYQSRKSDRYYY